MHDHVDHAVVEQVLGALEALGELFADGLLDDAGTGKADQRARLGHVHIAQHRVGRGHAAGRRVGEDDDVGQARIPQHLHADGGARHLHQGQDAFLHARAARGDEEHEGRLARNGRLHAGQHRLAGSHAEGTAHEGEVLHRGGHVHAAQLAGGHRHGIIEAGLCPGIAHAVGIALLVAELQRVGDDLGGLHLLEGAAVEKQLEPPGAGNPHVVAGIRHHPLVRLEIAMEDHLAGLGALDPEVLRHVPLLQQATNLRANDVVDPVQGRYRPLSCMFPAVMRPMRLSRGPGQHPRRANAPPRPQPRPSHPSPGPRRRGSCAPLPPAPIRRRRHRRRGRSPRHPPPS